MEPRVPILPEPELQIVPPDPKPDTDGDFWRRNSNVPLDDIVRRGCRKPKKPLPS
jgi:hypothetical protein